LKAGVGKLLSDATALPLVSQIHSKFIEPRRLIESFSGWSVVVAPPPERIVIHKGDALWSEQPLLLETLVYSLSQQQCGNIDGDAECRQRLTRISADLADGSIILPKGGHHGFIAGHLVSTYTFPLSR
jgi:hypothetical protein